MCSKYMQLKVFCEFRLHVVMLLTTCSWEDNVLERRQCFGKMLITHFKRKRVQKIAWRQTVSSPSQIIF